MQQVVEAVKEIVEQRRKAGIVPFAAPEHKVMSMCSLVANEYNRQLDEAIRTGKVYVRKTINGKSIYLNDLQQ